MPGDFFAHFAELNANGSLFCAYFHLPDDERWKWFRHLRLIFHDQNIEERWIADCRKRFEYKSQLEPIPELCTDDWLARCAWPLGMNGFGKIENYGFVSEET